MIELNRKNIEDIASLTFMQEGMLFHYLKDPGDDAYFEQLSLRISDHINDQIFKQAWKVVIRTNEMLRTVFRWENLESPIQIVLKKCQLRFKYYDFSGQEDNEAARAVEDIKVKDRKKKFDLRKVPFRVILCKIQESKYEMIISNHHILYDGWSNGIILKEFFEAYEALICRANARPFREHPKTKFKEYIKFKQHQDKEKEKKFWRSYFQGFDTQIGLSVKRGKRRNKTGSENHRVRFERKDKDRLEDFVKRQKLTLASLFYSAWGLLLQKYNSSDDVIFGTTVSGRTAKIHGIENIVGLFINTLPLRVQTTPGETLKDLLRRVDHVLRVREEFENSSLPDIKKYSNIDTKGELFDSIVILENYPLQLSLNNWSGEERDRFSLAVESYSIVEETHYDLTVRITVFEELEVSFIYPEEVFYDGCIVNMSHHFRKIIRQVVTNPMAKISQLEIISREEKNRILYDFNNTGADFPKNRTIHQLFEEQSNRAPFRTALIGTVQEAQSTRMHLEGTRGLAPLSRLITITYGELYERSNQLARLLQEKGIGADTIVAIMMERSVEMMIGIMGILKAGGAYLPIDPGYPGERIKYIMEDSTAKILLTSDAINRVPTPHHLSFHPSILPSFHLHLSPAPAISLAYLIYTSGSTGQPKGVMIGHYSVINRLNWMQAAYPIGPGDMILQKTPLVFDVSVWELFWWSFQGAYLYLLAPGDEKDPGAILEVIERFGVTTMHFVPSMLNAFLDYVETLRSKIGSGRCQFLLKSLKQVFSSGESLGVVQVERFHALFKRCTCPKLINLYGPTEATVDVSYFDCSGKEKLEKVPIGKPIHNIQLVVLDSGLHLQPIGITGELAISGVGLARGYLNQPELTAEKFVLAHSSWLIADRKTMKVPVKFPMSYQLSAISYIYRTGDLARWLPDGNIEFLGRMDQQVKVRGFRIELGEIENHLLVMEEIKDAVVLAREDRPGDKYLCAYIVSQGELELSILRDHLSGRLPDYMIPSYFVQLEEIPLTPNGKVDRKALPEPGISIGKDYTAARDKIEKKLLEIWWEILSRDTLHASQLRPSLGIDDNFFELGGHSLKVILLVAKIHKAFEVKIPLGEVFKRPSIRQLAEYIKAAKKRKYAGIEPVEKKEYYALSSAQKPMYFLQQMDVESTAYNMPCFLLLGKDMEKEKPESAFRELIRRHDSLRTSFVSVNDNPVQRIHDRVEFKIEYDRSLVNGHCSLVNCQGRGEVSSPIKIEGNRPSLLEGTRGLAPLFIKEFIRPFDLSQAPLLRVRLIELPPTPASRGGHSRPGAPASQKGKEHKYILMLDMHHIISDGVSMEVFIRDFTAVYSGKELAPLGISYKDFSVWQHSSPWRESIKNQGAYWLKQFEDEIPVLNLPLDDVRAKEQDFSGHTLHFQLEREDTERLNRFVKRQGITLFMALLAAFNILMSKLSGQNDILVGTPAGGRKQPELENIMGMFVNTLVLRSFPAGDKGIPDFLREIKEMTLGAFENRDYPFEELVRHLVKEREVGRNPLFDVMFTLQDLDIAFIPLPGLTVTPLEYDMGISKFDLTIIGEKAGDKMLFKVEYRTRLFKETTIKRLLGYFKTIVIQMMGVPGICIRDIELMPAEEKEEILSGFNDTGVDYPAHKTIYQLFAEQAQGWQDRIAVSGPAVGARFIASISYRALTEISHQQARLLGKTGVKPEVIVGLMLEPSLEMIIAILGILRAGGAYLPIDPDYPEERIKYMLKDSGVKILVTVPGLSEKFEKLLIANCQLLIVNCQGGKTPSCPQHLSTAPATAVSSSSASTLTSTLTWQVSPANLAYIIYTSGSSGKPKGVMVEHSSVVNLAFAQKRRFNIDRHDRILQFSSICFDASVEQIFIALFNGAALILINKDTLLDIDKFASFLSSRLITHLNAVPSFLNQIELQEGKGYSLKRIISGGEVCPVSLAVKLSYFCDFYNQYGPTETTVTSIALMIENEKLEGTLPRLPIGRPIDNTVVYVLDKWKKPVCLGVVGELYIGGAGLARGYLNNPELTAEKFVLAHSSWLIADRKTMKVPVKFPMSYQLSAISYIYRTGDLARWLPDGNIEFFGRMDQQVKIRGFRIELGEIENQLLVMEEIKDAVVVTGEDRPGDRYLCAYLVSQEELEPSILRGHLSGCLPDYMIPSYFVQLGEIPLTPNGKVDRQALPAPGIGIGKYYAAPRDKIERNLLEIWLEILCRDALHESQLRPSLGIDDNFFELGGHSLKVTLQVSKIHKAFEVKIPLAEVFKRPTIRQLAGYIKAAKKSKYAGIEPVEKKEYYALSSAQKPMYFLQQMDVESTAYNMPCFLLLGKDMEKEKLESAFRELIRRHDSLRTSFVSVNDNPVQRIHDRVEFKIEYYDRKEVEVEVKVKQERFSLLEGTRGLAPLFIKEFIRPFDLSQAPLLRVGLIELPPTPPSRGGHSRPGAPASQKGKEHKYILMLDMHHIISDGVSMEVFIRDFTAVYSGKELAPLGISYKDFSVWQHSSPWRESIKNQGAYWFKQFEDEIPVLNLPLDDVRAKEQDFAGHTLHFQLEREDTERLNRFIKRQGITLFMALLAAFNILVGKLSGQDDILVGTPAGGRKQPELENIMGMFVNTLVLRSFPAGDKGIPDFLREIKEMTLGAFENRDYPFEELVRHLVKEREVGRNPLFDVMFTLQDLDIAFIPLPGLTVTPLEYDMGISKFDLTIIGEKAGDKMLFKVEYRPRLFKETTIKRLLEYFKTIVIQMMGVPGICIRDIELMPAEEKEEILFGFNDTGVDYPAHKTIYQLFAEQAQGWQDRIAVSGPAVGTRFIASISYRALTEISHQQARLLGQTGVKPEVIVGLMLEPSLEMIIAILGILRAGGAYLPIDPDYPEERIKYMLKDSGAKILVTVPGLSEKFEKLLIVNYQLLIVNCQGSKTPSCPQHLSTAPATAVSSSSASTLTSTLTCQVSPANLAYIIYTSGSSGKPKGVMVEHSSVVNLAFSSKRRFNIDTHDRILQFSSICFDASVEQIFIALFNGAALILIKKDTLLDIDKFASFLSSRLITHLDAVPSFLNQIELQEGKGYSLKRIISGGEVCPVSLAGKLGNFCDFYNQYGPTETTVTSIALMIGNEELEETLSRLPIGRPIDNTVVYVLDKWKKPVCLGVVGELYIGGAGLARGYLNQPELTAEKFVLAHSSWLIADRKTMKVPVKFPMSYQLSAISYIYRTGDLARWLPDGNIEYFGRMDQQVKVRGFRIELGEIENHLLVMEGINDAVVVTREDRPGDRYLCAYLVSQEELEPSVLRDHLSGRLPDYMIPSYFVQLEEIPLTFNGKVDRKVLPEPEISIGKEYAAPRDKIEKKLVEIWLEILCRDSLHASQLRISLGIDDNFFELGGHSLKVTLQVSKIHQKFEVKIPLAEVFKRPTIRQLAEYIKAAKKSKYAGIEPVEKKEYYALSSAQKRMYFLQQIDVESSAYNMPSFLPLGKDMEKERLESALQELINRHESLRTSFVGVNDNPVQRIHDRVEFKIQYDRSLVNCQGRGEVSSPNKIETIFREFIRPFDLSKAPLLRVGLIQLPPTPASHGGHPQSGAPASQEGKERKYILMVDMHHIISDGTSSTVLVEDFLELYPGNRLPGLRLQYKDFSHWQNRLLESGQIKVQEDYWLDLYSDAGRIPRLSLPADHRRPEIYTFAGDRYSFIIEKDDAVRFKALGIREGGTLYMNILAVLNTLFYRYTNQEDIIIGSGIAGRPHADLQQIMGMFVNTLAIRNYPHEEKTYRSFLEEVIAHSVTAFENQDLQFEELVDKLELERDPSRNPLFDVCMVVQNFRKAGEGNSTPGDAGESKVLLPPEEDFSYGDYKHNTAKFDLTFFIHEIEDNIYVDIEYYTGIFKQETIKRLVSHFRNIIKAIVHYPSMKLKDIQIISPREKRQVLYEFNAAVQNYPKDKTIHHLFEEQVERTPDHIALVGPQMQYRTHMTYMTYISYREINTKSNQLAHYLYEAKGVQPADRVGILLSRSLNWPMAVLGVLKSGAAFVPIDPLLPEERVKYMITEAWINIIISEKRFIKRLNRWQWECHHFGSYLCLDTEDIHGEEELEKNQLMDEELWHHVGETAVDDITAGGWLSSYTGEPLSREEMDEYAGNVLRKLAPLFKPDMRVLEIGCASGITMFRLAPEVGLYYGTDLSGIIIERNRNRVREEGHQNIKLACLAAHESDQIRENNFDLVIMNSVVQCFHGHHYLRKVMKQAINLLGQRGHIFIGDIMDQEKKNALIRELKEFKYNHRDKGYTTKTDFSAELFISRGFWQDLEAEFAAIETIEFTDKIYTIENELTKFRYDTLISINKNSFPVKEKKRQKQKTQEGLGKLTLFKPAPIHLHQSSRDPAYIIYTSGTTGKPKGVLVEHRSLVNLVYWHNREFGISVTDRASLYAAFGFDASIWELFPYLIRGACLHIISDALKLDIAKLKEYYIENCITISFLPTQVCEHFIRESDNCSLRVLLTGGDKLRTFVKRSYDLYNNYGPTENTVVTTSFRVEKPLDNLPIGKPIVNNVVYIFDREGLHLQPVGVVGELCISGDGLARGYLNNPELTLESFINYKLQNTNYKQEYNQKLLLGVQGGGFLEKSPPGRRRQKIYRTGDLARWLPDGNIEFLGRMDQQVKIRGFRIELSEIENQLMDIEGIKKAVVVTREDRHGDKYLCSYIVSEEKLDPSILRDHLSGRLPDYMIPSHFVKLEDIPLTSNGKVDRKALPEPGISVEKDYAAPRDEIEKKLVEIWSEILCRDASHASQLRPSLGIDDNFFELGGHSLKATFMLAKIRNEFNIDISLGEIFKTPNIRGIASLIKAVHWAAHQKKDINQEREEIIL